jgi:hypothetical protein
MSVLHSVCAGVSGVLPMMAIQVPGRASNSAAPSGGPLPAARPPER